MTTRRGLLIALGSGALHWANAVFGQSKPPILIGWLDSRSKSSGGQNLEAFKDGMAALGWKEGSNYVLEVRWADGSLDRLPTLAQELKARKPALIVASPLAGVIAAAKASPDIPVVQASGGTSSVAVGLAKSLARPGGMVTGLTNLTNDVAEKFLELLIAAAPYLKRIGILVDPASDYEPHLKTARLAAANYRVEVSFAEAAKAEELESAITRLVKEGVQGLVLLPSAWFGVEAARIVKLALGRRWPVIGGSLNLVQNGALLSYSANTAALSRRAAWYVDQILKGAKPGDLPIEQPTKFELVVNMKTAKALGLTIPQPFLMRADKVIE